MTDNPNLEKGQGVPQSDTSNTFQRIFGAEPPHNDQTGRRNPTERKLEGDPDAPYAIHCRPDAEIWKHYLKETEIEDRELTEIWNNTLDSLLVFAGLFAGILTAFVVESRHDLTEDPQEQLLKQIVDLLSNTSSREPFQPNPSSLHVNGLWFTSLTLTLISALGGVLAKSWLAKYNPASQREQSSDACERHLRSMRAGEWQLERVITGIPLLIQLSLLLFFVGLIIRLLDHDVRIWSVVVILVGFTVLFYIVVTCLPWFSPACPFQTPLSSLYAAGMTQGRYRDNTRTEARSDENPKSWKEMFLSSFETTRQFLHQARQKPEQLVLQTQILAWSIINSTKDAIIAEAIRAVAGSKQTEELKTALLGTGARDTLYQKLQYYVTMTPGLPKSIEKGQEVEALLYALLQIEAPIMVDEGPTGDAKYYALLADGRCLHRWDDFQPYLQRLAFSLRVHILVNSNQDDHDENFSQTLKNLARMAEMGAPQNVQKVVYFATIRGLLNGKPILQRICGIVLSKLVALAGVRESIFNIGQSIEKCTHNDKRSVSTIQAGILASVMQLCGDENEGIREAGSWIVLKLAKYKKSHRFAAMTIPKLIELLKITLPRVRWTAITTIADLAEDANNRVAIGAAIPYLVEQLNDENGDTFVASAAGAAILKLYTYIELQRTIESSFTSLIEQLHHLDVKIRLVAVSALNNLTVHPGIRTALGTIGTAIPYLFGLLQDSDAIVQNTASSVLVAFIPHAELNAQINDYAPLLIEQLKEPDSSMRMSAAFILKNLAEHPGPHVAIGAAIPLLIDLVNDPDYSTRFLIISALNALADHAELRSRLRAAITPLVKLIEISNSNIESEAAHVLAKLANDAELRIEIGDSIPLLIKLLGAPTYGSPSGATLALASLAEDADLCVKIDAAILPLIERVQDSDTHIRTPALIALHNLSRHVKFRAIIRRMAPLLIGLLKDPFFNASYPATFALANLAKDVELCDTMEAAVPLLIEQLKDSNQDVAIEILSSLVEHGKPPAAICDAIPHLIEITKYTHNGLSASLLKTLAKNENFSDKFMVYVPILIGSLWEKSAHSSSAAAEIIFHLSLDATRYNLIKSTLLNLILNASSSFTIDNDSLLRFMSSNNAVDVSSPVNSSNPEQTRLAESWTSIPQPPEIGTLWYLLNHKNGTKSQNGAQSLFQMAKILKEIIQPAEGVVENLLKHAPYELLPSLCTFVQHGRFKQKTEHTVGKIMELARNSEKTIRSNVISVLARLADNSEFRPALVARVPSLIDLLKDPSEQVRLYAVFELANMAEYVELRSAVGACIPSLIESTADASSNMALSAISLLHKLSKHKELLVAVSVGIPQLIRLLKESSWTSQAASALAEIARHAEFRRAIITAIPLHVDQLTLSDYNALRVEVCALAAFAEDVESRNESIAAIPLLVDLLDYPNVMIQIDAATALVHMAIHVEHHIVVDRIIPSILMFGSSPFGDSLRAASALVELAQHVDFSVVVETVVAPLIEKLDDSDPYIRMRSATIIARFAEDQKFWDTVNETVPSFVTLLGDTEEYVRSAATAVFDNLAKHDELHKSTLNAMATVVPLLVEHLAYSTWIAFVGDKGAASALINLASHRSIHPFFTHSLPRVLALLKHNEPRVRASAAAVIERWIKYPEIQSYILRIKAPDTWTELLNDPDETAIEPLARIFCHLVTNGWIYNGILSLILKALGALEGRNAFSSRWGAIMLLTMASNARLRDAMVEVFTIHSSIRHFIKDISAQEADLLLLKMETFGILKEL